MSLTAEQKEAIMAARGASAVVAASGVRRYEARFADGKRDTALDMNGGGAAETIAAITNIFQPGYCVAVEPVNA